MHVYVSLEEILHQVTASLRAGDKPLSKAIMTRGTDASVRRKKSFESQISKLLHGLGVFFLMIMDVISVCMSYALTWGGVSDDNFLKMTPF